jgi:hypothetical protein
VGWFTVFQFPGAVGTGARRAATRLDSSKPLHLGGGVPCRVAAEQGLLMRSYIRHPSDIPIEYQADAVDNLASEDRLNNISHGGLSFTSEHELAVGTVITIRINLIKPRFEVKGQVAWCQREKHLFVVGVRFMEESDLFRLRMVEQICHIEHYKSKVQAEEGRQLTGEQAAREWIQKFAGQFPQLFDKTGE